MRPDGRPSGPGRAPVAKVFLALWPEPSVAAGLHAFAAEQAKRLGGRVMRQETLHLTLAFLGAVSRERLRDIEAVARATRGLAFDFQLDQSGVWREKHLLWAGCRSMRKELANLAAELAAGLRKAGFALEARTFKPHVTLVRNFRAELAMLPELPVMEWSCFSFVLVQSAPSVHGANYRKLASWSLAR